MLVYKVSPGLMYSSMSSSLTRLNLFVAASSSITIVNGPQNVTAAVGSNVIFPCESDQGSTLLPLWKINGIPYTLTSLPSWHWFGSDGLHVDRITADTNNTKYVCYFVINNEVAVESKPAFLLVITPRINGEITANSDKYHIM